MIFMRIGEHEKNAWYLFNCAKNMENSKKQRNAMVFSSYPFGITIGILWHGQRPPLADIVQFAAFQNAPRIRFFLRRKT